MLCRARTRAWLALVVLVVILLVASWPAAAQSDPRTLPRADFSAVTYKGVFSFDWSDGAGGDLSYGGGAIGVSEDGRALYWSCVQDRAGIAKLSIPAVGGIARVLAPCLGLTGADIAVIHPDRNAFRPMLGGVLELGGRLAVSAFISYDATGQTTASHWGGVSLSALAGPYAGTVPPGFVKSQQAPIPPEWRALLGGDALASAGYTSIISRASYGPSVSSYTVADVGTKSPIPMTMLIGCPHSIAACVTYGTPTSNDYNGSELSGGFFIVPGTRTIVFVEREASGPTCYGYATRNQADHGKPYLDAVYCYSLSDPLDQKGPKGYPYRHVAKLVDLADLVEVKQGRRNPWDVKPYAVITLPATDAGLNIESGTFNPTTCEYYQVRAKKGGVTDVHVFGGFCNAPAPPPPPPPSPEVCGDGIDNDGDGLTDEGCAPPPPPPAPAPTFVGQFRSQVVYTANTIPAGLRVTLSVPVSQAATIPPVDTPIRVTLATPDGVDEVRTGRVRRITLNAYKGPPAEHAVELEFPKAPTDPSVSPFRVRVTLATPVP